MRHDDEAREEAEETRMYEREQEMREAGTRPVAGYYAARGGTAAVTMERDEHGESLVVIEMAGSSDPSPLALLPMVLDTDENGDPRGIAAAISQAQEMTALEPDDDPAEHLGPGGRALHGHDETAGLGAMHARAATRRRIAVADMLDHEQAAPDDHDIALVQHAIEPPAGPLLPRAQLLFAAAARMTSAIRLDSVEPKLSHLTLALGAANLVAIYLPTLVRGLEEEVEKRASTFPRECSCGRVISREQWAAMPLVGVHRDDVVELEMKHCECRSTLAMPVGA